MNTFAHRLSLSLALFSIWNISSCFAIEREQVVNELKKIHQADWPSLINGPQDPSKIENHLHSLILDPSQFEEYTHSLNEIDTLSMRALSEYGHFATSDKGHLRPKAKTLYQKIKAQWERPDHKNRHYVSFITSLALANTPQSTEIILELLESNNQGTLALALSALKMQLSPIKKLKETSLKIDNHKTYHPNLGKPLSERPNQKEWLELFNKILKKLNSIQKNASIHASIKKMAYQTQLQSLYFASGEGFSSSSPKNDKSITKADKKWNHSEKDKRLQKKPKDVSSNSTNERSSWWYLYAILAIFGIFYIIKKSRKNK